MSTILSCQEPHFGGGQGQDCPCSDSASAASVDVSKETWVSFWASGLPDNTSESPAEGQAPDQFCGLDFTIPDDTWQGDQLSSQLYRNKQLQDTLLQKEEELARLHEENNNLRQYLNSAVVKCLEDKAKKLLLHNGQKKHAILRSGKRKFKEDSYLAPRETPHPSKARRNLLSDFTACEEQAAPPVDTWVLQTLGLKDINTIDESLSANYSALSSELGKSPYCQSHGEAMDYCNDEDPIAAYGCDQMTLINSTAAPGKQASPFIQPLSSAPCASSMLPSGAPFPPYGSPYFANDVSPNKTDMAFTTSVSPHRNVKTHTFHQGQVFVRREEDGGWKFTWVPKQSE
ncbi:geminin coiled-coil domain-containing protein 1 [Gopherus flavomarginatus]|uniref:geminin coiled-coil domain-containing protein 1 n=1 Tax=Gopherus flavomarginatus TaxID=286002 RepID=UPI0021CC4D29|nr:geminin coiled-coil domain-containing protein 1 [Gopherus flavomarginatus]